MSKESLAKARALMAERRARGETIRPLTPIEKARRNPKSLRLAVTAYCWTCEGEDADPDPKWRVAQCEITDCPLWHVRPWQKLVGTPPTGVLRRFLGLEDDPPSIAMQNAQEIDPTPPDDPNHQKDESCPPARQEALEKDPK